MTTTIITINSNNSFYSYQAAQFMTYKGVFKTEESTEESIESLKNQHKK